MSAAFHSRPESPIELPLPRGRSKIANRDLDAELSELHRRWVDQQQWHSKQSVPRSGRNSPALPTAKFEFFDLAPGNDSGYISRSDSLPPPLQRSPYDTDGNSTPASSLGPRTPVSLSSGRPRRGSSPTSIRVEELEEQNAHLVAELHRLKFELQLRSERQSPIGTPSRRSIESFTDSSVLPAPQPSVAVRPPIPKARAISPLQQDELIAEPERVVLPQSQHQYKDLVLPASLPSVTPPQRSRDEEDISDEEQGARSREVSSEGSTEEKAPQDGGKLAPAEKLSFFGRTKASFYATYAPRVEPALILPTGPTDVEKHSYLKTNRALLYSGGVFSFFSLTAGMWLFTISSPYFAWFGVFCGALQLYMGISYWVGLVGKDFDFKNHEKLVAENPIVAATCPTVDIYLPCCKEPLDIIENTYKHISKLDYPQGKLKVYVLDDGAMPAVEALAKQYNFEYIVRSDRPRLKKAGNLRWAFARTQGDFFNIYDADFCPRPDFLKEIIPRMMADPEIAIIQTPQYFRVLDSQTWVEQGAGAIQELFYRVIQVNRDRWGASICVGSNAVYRRAALEEVGGTAEIGFSEDVHTGFGCVDRGWKLRYIPLCLACGVCPDSPRAFFSQQMRWCMGSTTLLSNPEFWSSKLTKMQKVCYLCGMMYYSAVSLSIFVNPLPGIFMIWLRPDYFRYYNLAFALPSIIYTLITFRLWAKAAYGMNVQYIQVIQGYAYLTAIKDRVLGKALMWAPSGDAKAHKNNKYRNMRILAWTWLITWMGALLTGMVWQILHGLKWYECIPLLILDSFNLWIAHRFLLCSGS